MRGVKTGRKIAYYFYIMFFLCKHIDHFIKGYQRTVQKKQKKTKAVHDPFNKEYAIYDWIQNSDCKHRKHKIVDKLYFLSNTIYSAVALGTI